MMPVAFLAGSVKFTFAYDTQSTEDVHRRKRIKQTRAYPQMKKNTSSSSPSSLAIYSGGEIMGDAMAKLSMVRALRTALPRTRIVWIIQDSSLYDTTLRPLTEGAIDEFLYLPSPDMHWKDLFGRPLFNGRTFDILLDTQTRTKRSFWLKRKIRHGVFITSALGGLFSDRRNRDHGASGKGMLNRLMGLGSLAAGTKLVAAPLDLNALPNWPKWDTAARDVLPDGPRYIGLVVGAGDPNKRWPLDRFVALSHRWATKGGTPVFILGPAESHLEAELRERVPNAVFPLSDPDLKDPLMSIAVAKRLALTVANDSGGAHLMSSADQPMVWIFRKAVGRDKWAPPSQKITALAPQDFGGVGLEDIPLDAVDGAMNALLERG